MVLHAWCARQSCPRGAAYGYSKSHARHLVAGAMQRTLCATSARPRKYWGAWMLDPAFYLLLACSLRLAVASARVGAAKPKSARRGALYDTNGPPRFGLFFPGAIMAAVVTARPKVLVVCCLTQGSGTTAAAPRCTTDAVFCSPCLHPVMARWEIRPRESLLSRRCSNREGSASPKRTT